MKWLGALLLVLGGGAAGMGKTASIRRRIALLEELAALILHIRTELRQCGTPLPEILEGYRPSVLPLKDWAGELRKGRTVLQTAGPWLDRLDTDTGRIATELCAVLGRYDSGTQAQACDRAAQLLASKAEDLRRQLAEKGRLYHTVPLSLGLMAALALF